MTGFDARRQPPVEVPASRPNRLSQTLLAKHDVCPHDAYLYLTHGGGALSHHLTRGSLFHAFAERAMWTLIENGESRLYALTEGEDPMQAKAQVAALTEAIVDECAREMDPEPPAAEVDAVREMAYHWATGLDVEPETVAGVELRFELDVAGWVVVCKIDLLSTPGDLFEVSDYKTTFDVEGLEAVTRRFQLWTYGAAVAFGYPTRKVSCPTCDPTCEHFGGDKGPDPKCSPCEGRGYLNERLEPIGQGVNYFKLREVYPRFVDKDTGLMWDRAFTVTRTQLHNFMVDLTRAVEKIAGRFESNLWPAVPGDKHCGYCTARGLCPLPRVLRSHAGDIESLEQAQEALELVEAQSAQHAAIKKEARNFAKREGVSIRVGRDLVYEFGEQSKKVTDYDALEEGVQRAVMYGEPFDLGAFRRTQTSTPFRRRRLKPEELEGEAA